LFFATLIGPLSSNRRSFASLFQVTKNSANSQYLAALWASVEFGFQIQPFHRRFSQRRLSDNSIPFLFSGPSQSFTSMQTITISQPIRSTTNRFYFSIEILT
jgi:hypothetical protein